MAYSLITNPPIALITERAAVETVGAYLALRESDSFADGVESVEFQGVHTDGLADSLNHGGVLFGG